MVAYRVFGQLLVSTDGGQTPIARWQCGADTGPWLLSATSDQAVMTCVCGTRGRHPDVTPDRVKRHTGEAETVYPSLRDAETALGFGGPVAGDGRDHHGAAETAA